ncbi:MAG: LamG-like jellyroll fold domain-containing protein, partial [Saprospiraceae bacterium]
MTTRVPLSNSFFVLTGIILLALLFAQRAQAQETEVTLSGGILTVTDINGGSSNDNLRVSFSAGAYTITDLGGLIISTAIAGATGSGTALVTVPNTGVNGMNIQALGGNDDITILSVDNLTGDFTINAGSGNDDVAITNATISLSGNGNDVNIEAEQIVMNGTSAISVTGTGVINIKANEGVSSYTPARIAFTNFSLSAEDGDITLLGVSYGAFSGDEAVLLIGTTSEIVTTGAGNISISGEAPYITYAVAAIAVDGISVRAEGTGNITFTGKSQRTSGVRFDKNSGGGAEVSAIDGNITINGETSGPNFGIVLKDDALIETTGTGNIFLNGTGLPANALGIQFGLTNIMVKASGSGNIQTTGNGGFRDIRFAGGTIGDAAGTGNITFIANDYDLAYSSSTIQGAGNLFFEPLTGSATIGLGAATGTPSIPNSIINQIQPGFNSITIGDGVKTSVVIAGGADFSAANTSVILQGTTIRDLNNAGTDITSISTTGKGNLAPGASPGIFAVSGNYTFANSSTFTVEIDDAGTAGTDYDQLDATGAVAIGSTVTLSLDIDPGYTPTAGDEFIIVKSGTGLSGTFNGLPEGSIATNIGGLDFYISYAGGDGNDVALKAPLPAAALDFDGVNDQANLPFLFDPSATNFTAEAWVKPTLVDGNAHIFVQQNDGTGTGRTFLAIGSANKFYTFQGGSALSGTTTVSANTWYHVAVTWDGAMLRLFVNGVEEASASASIVNADGTMILGTGKSGVLPYQGVMDDVRFWTRALCKEELLNNMNCELSGSETGLLAYYQFNQGLDGVPNPTETTLQEFSNTYDGTLANFALTGATSNWVKPGAVTTGVSCSAFAIANFDPAACACELGYYATLDGSGNITACTICPPGTYCPDGINQYDCAAGYFQASAGATQCNACPPGKYQSNSGAVECLNCDVGTYNPNSAAVSCQNCPQGTYSDSQGQIVCETCEPGSVATTTGSAACVDCGDPVFNAPCPALTPVTVNADPGGCSASVTLAIPTLNEDCTRNHALQFDGVDDYVALASSPVTGNADFTVEAWFLSQDDDGLSTCSGNFERLIGIGGTRLEVGECDGIFTLYSNQSGTISSSVNTGDGNWHHFAVVKNGINVKVYIDGNEEINFNNGGPVFSLASPFRIGRWPGGGAFDQNWEGKIDEVRIWSIPRTAGEIAATMNLEINATYPGLISYYNFNEGIACCDNTGLNTLPDGMGVNDGTLNGFDLSGGCTSNWVAGAPALGDPLTLVNDLTNDCSDPSGVFNVGVHTVTWTATGANGETATCVQTVTVEDDAPPVITCASNVTINTTSGLCTGTTTLTAPTATDNCSSAFGNALHFDGTNDYVNAGNITQVNGVTKITLESWVYPTNGGAGVILCKGPATSANAIDIERNGQTLYFRVCGAGDSYGYVNSVLPTNTWTHIACVYDGTQTGNANRLKIYVNGVQQTLTFLNTIPATTPNSGNPLTLGSFNGGLHPFGGALDEVRIWNTARTQAEIQANMHVEISAQSGLAALFHFNHGLAYANNAGVTTATDASGNGYDGTLNNFGLNGTSSNWIAFSPTLSNNAPATYPIGNTTVTWTAKDAAGNTANCAQTVTVQAPEMLVEGNSIEITDGDNSPALTDDTDFGDQSANSTTDRTFTIRNTGTTTLNLTGNPIVAISGASEFSVFTQPSGTSIAPNGNLTFVVRYAPVSPGSHTATISIANDDCDENPYTFNVLGEVLCDISITSVLPTPETCPGANDGTITVTAQCNSCSGGNSDIRYSIDNSDFSNTTGAFTGLAPGSYTVYVRDVNDITCTDSDGPHTVAVGVDNTDPTPVCNDITIQLDVTGNYTLTQANIDAIGAGSADNCTDPGDLTLSVSPSSFDCDDVILGQPNDYALDLDGQNDYIQSAATNVLKVLPLSVEAWVKPAMRTENTTFYPNNVLSNDLPGNHGHGFGANVNSLINQITIEYENGFRIIDNAGLSTNTWQHIAVVYTSGNVKTYVNGALIDNFNYSQATLNAAGSFWIGKHNDDGGYGTRRFYKGQVDEVRVWHRALTQQEIQDNMNTTSVGDESDLELYYTFEDGPGSSIVTDILGNANATLISMDPNTDWVTPGAPVVPAVLGASATLTVTDEAGNDATCAATVTVEDVTPPVPQQANGSSTIACPALAVAPAAPQGVDACDGNISAVLVSTVNNPNPITCEGTRVYTYSYTDASGNSQDWTYTYTIEYAGFTLPANGGSTVDCPDDTDVVPTPPTVTDNCGVTLTPSGPAVSAEPTCEGTRTYTWTYTDCEGNSNDWTYTYTIDNNTPPVITLLGDASLVICKGATYNDAGATASDDCQGDITGSISTVNPVNTAVAGVYTVTYNVSDCANNAATEVTRTVQVIDAQMATPTSMTDELCSGETTPITVAYGADTDNLKVEVSVTQGTPTGNTASPYYLGNGAQLEANALNNIVNQDAILEYTITPYHYGPNGQDDQAGGDDCTGQAKVVTITIKPEPVGANKTYKVCSGTPLSIDLQGLVDTDGNGVQSTFSWVAANNAEVDGENSLPTAGSVINNQLSLVVPANGVKTVVYTVSPTGQNGCVGDNFTITVEVHPCEVTIIDPCACLDNATTLSDGQFSETVEVTGPSGDSWTVVVAPGLYLTGSPAPPAAPLPVPA